MTDRSRGGWVLLVLAAGVLGAGCGQERFEETLVLGGARVDPGVLNLGRQTYTLYCRACHGVSGDGNGPAAKGLRPRPRDLRQGLYKFAAVESGYLPTDEDFRRIIQGGLKGTAMLPWGLPEEQVHAVTQYLKTFAPAWLDEYEEVGEPIRAEGDPYAPADRGEAVSLGKKLYHGLARCHTCHPAYASDAEIRAAGEELTGFAGTRFAHEPEVEQPDDPGPTESPPPDFSRHLLRTGDDVASLYRIIAAGVGGTAMPTWKGALPDAQLWAIAYYVESLARLRGTPEAAPLARPNPVEES